MNRIAATTLDDDTQEAVERMLTAFREQLFLEMLVAYFQRLVDDFE